jgi:hypothetical protein
MATGKTWNRRKKKKKRRREGGGERERENSKGKFVCFFFSFPKRKVFVLIHCAFRGKESKGSKSKTQEKVEPGGYSLQSKSDEEKMQFIKARMGLAKEVNSACLFCLVFMA